jgi:small acid-soluble spore protein F (minor alpha/beta-type SASP)
MVERTKSAKSRKKKPLTPKERLKLKIAKELGLLEKLKREGWGGLSAQECGQVGGILSRRMRRGDMVK